MSILGGFEEVMKILFVCTGNTCRSPMAAALMNKIAKENEMDVIATSAGVFAEAGAGASENAIKAMRLYQLSIKDHKATQLTEKMIQDADIVLTMTDGQKMMIMGYAPEKVFSIYEFLGYEGEISDPYGGDLEEYEETASEIYDCLVDIAEELVE